MARTFNRQPFSVSTPSSGEAKDYFFNHSNWKGMSDDKNFLTADQETFESCKNVYMDSEGLLRSRPSLKRIESELNIVNLWVFGNLVLILSKTESNRYDLYLSDIDSKKNVSTVDTDYYYLDELVKPLQIEDKIFILSTNSFRYINTKSFEIGDAVQFIYTPETKVYTSATKNESAESKNVLTDNEIFTYLYDSDLNTDFMIGKDLYFTLLDKTYTVKFNSLTPLTFIKKLPIINPSGNCIYQVFPREGYDSIAVLIPSTRKFLYSLDGTVWNLAKDIPGEYEIVDGKFTQDGNEFYCKTTDSSLYLYYIVSVVKTEKDSDFLTYRFPDFTSYEEIRNLSADSYVLYLVSWNTGVSLRSESREGLGHNIEYMRIFLSNNDVELDLFDLDVTPPSEYYQVRGEISMFINFHRMGPVVFIRQGFRGALRYVLIDDAQYQFVATGQLSFPGSSGSQDFPDNITRSGENLIFTYWNSDTLTQYVIRPGGGSDDGYFNSVLLYQYNVSRSTQLAVNKDASILMTPARICKDGLSSELLETPTLLLGAGNYFYSLYNLKGQNELSIYNNNVSNLVLKESIIGNNDKLFTFLSSVFDGNPNSSQLDETYLAANDTIYISSKRYDESGDILLYFPEVNSQKFTSKITGFQPISSSEMAIFLNDGVWYSQLTESGYSYIKSKLQVGLKDGADVITSYDGTQVIFPTKRGLVALTYQNFVASTDQALTFLSDSIHSQFVKFAENPIKLLRYQYWIICYCVDSKYGYVYDVRNNSWWPVEIFVNPVKISDMDNRVILLSNSLLFKLNESDDDYFDYDGVNKHMIDWNIKSQKLHLNAINYNKHIANITLMSVLDSNNDMSFKMKVNNYRKKTDTTDVQTSEYRVDAIRTFVQRVSFPKVNEFQYTLFADDEQVIRVPLSLSGITIKYGIGSQVR